MRAACRAGNVGSLLEIALVGPAPGGEIPTNTNPDVSGHEAEFAWISELNEDDASRAVFQVYLELGTDLLEGELAGIDAGLMRNEAELLKESCDAVGPGPGFRVPLFGLVRFKGMGEIKCASSGYVFAALQLERIRHRYSLR